LRPNSFEKLVCWLVVWVLGDELALEGLLEDRLPKLASSSDPLLNAPVESVSE
jgi:hypothetical protein